MRSKISFIGGFALTNKAWFSSFHYLRDYLPSHVLYPYTLPYVLFDNLLCILNSHVIVLHSVSSLLYLDILRADPCNLSVIIMLEPMLSPACASTMLRQIASPQSGQPQGSVITYLERLHKRDIDKGIFDFRQYSNPRLLEMLRSMIKSLDANLMYTSLQLPSSYRQHLVYTSNPPGYEFGGLSASTIIYDLNTHVPMATAPYQLSCLLASLIQL